MEIGPLARSSAWETVAIMMPGRGHYQVGSLAGAAHLLKNNAGVLRVAHDGQKPSVEQKGKCYLDFNFQCECKP